MYNYKMRNHHPTVPRQYPKHTAHKTRTLMNLLRPPYTRTPSSSPAPQEAEAYNGSDLYLDCKGLKNYQTSFLGLFEASYTSIIQ